MYVIQVWEGKPADEKKELPNGETKQKSQETAPETKEPASSVQANGDLKGSENGSAAKPTAVEKKILANGVANGC